MAIRSIENEFFERHCSIRYILRAALVLFAFYIVHLSFMKWPDVLVDFGRELYIPWQVSEGKVLYRDIAHFNGPFSVYLHAFLFSTIGVSIYTLVGFNLLLVAGAAIGIYALFRNICDEITAFATTGCFIGVFAFGQYMPVGNFNFVCPYSYETTHSVMVSILLLYIFHLHLRTGNRTTAVFAGMLTGILFLLKAEVFISAFLALVLCLAVIAWRSGVLRSVSIVLNMTAGFMTSVILMVSMMSVRMTVSEAIQFVWYPFKAISNDAVRSNFFYLSARGFDEPWKNLRTMVITATIYAALFYLLLLGAKMMGKIRRIVWRRCLQALLFLAVILSFRFLSAQLFWEKALSGLPLITSVMCLVIVFRIVRSGKEHPDTIRWITLLNLSLFSLFLMMKVILHMNVAFYGFALGMPATLFLIVSGLYYFPSVMKENSEVKGNLRYLVLMVVILFVLCHQHMVRNIYTLKEYPLNWNHEQMWDFLQPNYQRGMFVKLALEQIDSTMPPDSTFVVFPEGVIINYLTRRRNPTPYINFMPIELVLFGEQTIIASLERNPPDYILFVDKKTDNYGVDYFGTDYGVELAGWLKRNYRVIWAIGGEPLTGQPFGIQICRRIDVGDLPLPPHREQE